MQLNGRLSIIYSAQYISFKVSYIRQFPKPISSSFQASVIDWMKEYQISFIHLAGNCKSIRIFALPLKETLSPIQYAFQIIAENLSQKGMQFWNEINSSNIWLTFPSFKKTKGPRITIFIMHIIAILHTKWKQKNRKF